MGRSHSRYSCGSTDQFYLKDVVVLRPTTIRRLQEHFGPNAHIPTICSYDLRDGMERACDGLHNPSGLLRFYQGMRYVVKKTGKRVITILEAEKRHHNRTWLTVETEDGEIIELIASALTPVEAE